MNWDELHGNEVMRAKSDIVRTKVQTTYDKEEKTSQRRYVVPIYQSKKIFWEEFLEGQPSTQKNAELKCWLKKLGLPYSPECLLRELYKIKVLILSFRGGGICNKKIGSKYYRSKSRDYLHESETLPFEYQFKKISGLLKFLDTVETENSIGRLGVISW